jgi:hypothetical protein
LTEPSISFEWGEKVPRYPFAINHGAQNKSSRKYGINKLFATDRPAWQDLMASTSSDHPQHGSEAGKI